MGYGQRGAVSSVIISLRYLLQFMSMILRIKKFQIKALEAKSRQLVRLFEDFSSSADRSHQGFFLAQIMGNLENQNLSEAHQVHIQDSTAVSRVITAQNPPTCLAAGSHRTTPEMLDKSCLAAGSHHSTPEMLDKSHQTSGKLKEMSDLFEEMPEILEEYGLLEAELEKFYNKMPEILKDRHPHELKNFDDRMHALPKAWLTLYPSRHTPEEQKCFSLFGIEEKMKFWNRKHSFLGYSSNFFLRLTTNLQGVLSVSGKLKQETVFVHKEAMKIKCLCQDLNFFMTTLWDSAGIYRNHNLEKRLEKCMNCIPIRTEDFIEEKLLGMQLKLNASIIRNIESFQSVFSEVSNENHVILPSLLSILEATESMKEKVKTIHDEVLGIENLQSSGISAEVVSKPPLVKDSVVGLNDISNNIVDRLTVHTPALEMLTIIGMGGIGKTTLARTIFSHPLVVHHFHCLAWVTVSQVYKVRDLLLGLLLSVAQPTDGIYEKNNDQLAEYLYRRLKCRRYLIVMDDIWSTKAWDDVRRSFPDDRNGSRVLLTSRMKSVSVYVNPKSSPYCMSLLNVDESWELLEKKVFGKGRCPLELKDIGKQIAKSCQGLPLAIVVVAGHLCRIKRTYECWKEIAVDLSSIMVTDPEQCIEILALSYSLLPHNLKACFLYMGAFPEDWEIEVQKLINLWVAEGFLDQKSSKSLEEVAEDCLNDLVDRSLVLAGKRSSGGKIKTCRIHDLLRELCLREAQKENFMHVIKRDSHGFPSKLNDERRLSFSSESAGDVYLLPSLPLMRTFLCFSMGCGFTPDIFLFHFRFKLLRVLDIGFLHFDHFPAQILDLVLLRYLELTVSFKLPEQLSLLVNLYTLVIHGPWTSKRYGESPILSLPFWNMPWLRHLHVSVASLLRINRYIAKENLPYPLAPQCLQTLSTFRFSICRREVFEVMIQLKKLGICETIEDYRHQSFRFLSSLVYLKQLEILKCSFYMHGILKREKLICGVLPLSLRQLTLSWSRLPWEEIISISELPKLEVLKLKNYAFQGRQWTPPEDGFPCLKFLLIENTDLEQWEASSIHFPRLQHLVLRNCDFLERIPFSVGEIPTLELIELHNCSKTAEASVEEIRAQTDGVEIHIHSNQSLQNHRKRTLSSDSCSLLHLKRQMIS